MKKYLSLLIIVITILFGLYKYQGNNIYTYKTSTNKMFSDPYQVKYINKIEITYDPLVARLHKTYTYGKAKGLFTSFTLPEDSGYTTGNANVYIWYCDTSERCEYGEVHAASNGDMVKEDRYTYVEFDVYAEPFGTGVVNPEYSFDPEHLDDIEVWVNGVKRNDVIIRNFNDSWRCIDVLVPTEVDTSSIVTSIEISSETDGLQRGTGMQFTADVDYYGNDYDRIVWSVSGGNASSISSSGYLTVGANEEADYITVRGTSYYDNTKYDEKIIDLYDDPLYVESVMVSPSTAKVVKNGKMQFYSTIYGNASTAVTWSVVGANSASTVISDSGYLTVGADETATTIYVMATSSYDNTKIGSATVTVTDTHMIDRIDLEYPIDGVSVTSLATYSEVAQMYHEILEVLNEDMIYVSRASFVTCPSSSRCVENSELNYSNSGLMNPNKYTYVYLDVFAEPYGNMEENPLNDFDSENLDKIQVWVNGELVGDALVKYYNEYWRSVDVLIPVTVTNEKIVPTLYLNYTLVNVEYGDNLTIEAYGYNGDGEVTYSSTDPSVASVNPSTGEITINKCGVTEIIATSSETGTYESKSVSYTLSVGKKSISPILDGLAASYDYTGSQIKPEFTVLDRYSDATLVEGVDYTVTYSDNLNAGYHRGIIVIDPVDTSNYSFTAFTKYFDINKLTITDENITLLKTKAYYDGTEKEIPIRVILNEKELTRGVDYQLLFSSNINVGYGHVVVEGINNYSGREEYDFEIVELGNNIGDLILGDLNQNDKVDLPDIILALKYYLGILDITDEVTLIADMDANGSFGLKDIILLLKAYLEI